MNDISHLSKDAQDLILTARQEREKYEQEMKQLRRRAKLNFLWFFSYITVLFVLFLLQLASIFWFPAYTPLLNKAMGVFCLITVGVCAFGVRLAWKNLNEGSPFTLLLIVANVALLWNLYNAISIFTGWEISSWLK